MTSHVDQRSIGDLLRDLTARSAVAVGKEARDAGLGRLLDDEQLEAIVAKAQWEPRYTSYRPGTLHPED